MGVSKIEVMRDGNPETLIDLTNDTVEEEDVVEGVTFHNAAGEEKVGTLKLEVVSDYVVTEAESVLARVIEAQGNRTFNMPVITDLHNNGGASDAQITHACQGIGYIADRIKINAFACLGDHTDYDGSNWEKCLRDIIDCNGHKHKVRNVDYLEVQGNHDYSANRSHLTSKLISAFSTDVVWGSKLGGYFHKDYEDDKVRVIGVNTSEIAWIGVSPEQYRWFIETLDLSDKEDAGEWQILIISHVPLDYGTFTVFSYVLDAYVKGTSWTNGTYSCDYTGKNQATIIACVHGHIHNFLVEKMYLGNSSTAERIDVLRIAIPEVTELYSNHYSAPWKHDTTYSKVANTAKDTSFNILCIDLDEKKIEAICYGAGVDRTIDYANLSSGEVETPDEPEVPSGSYTNLVNTTPTKDTTITTSSEGWLENVRINSSKVIVTADKNHITNIISVGDATGILRIKGMDINGGYGRIYVYKGTTFVQDFVPTSYTDSFITLSDTYSEISLQNIRELYLDSSVTFDSIRIGGTLTGTKEDVIVTLDELITDSNTGGYTNIIDTIGYTDDKRLSTSTGELKTQAGYVTTGLIDLSSYPLNVPQTIRSSGVDFDYTKYSYCAICTYGEDGTLATANFTNDFGDADAIYDENGNLNFQISHTSKVKGFKVCGYGKGVDLVMTINEEITDSSTDQSNGLTWNAGKNCSYNVGASNDLVDGIGYAVSDIIEPVDGKTYKLYVGTINISGDSYPSIRAVYYDSTNTVLSVQQYSYNANSYNELSIPDGCTGFRIRAFVGTDNYDKLNEILKLIVS